MTTIQAQRCAGECKKRLPLVRFAKSRHAPNGRKTVCSTCTRSAAQAEHRARRADALPIAGRGDCPKCGHGFDWEDRAIVSLHDGGNCVWGLAPRVGGWTPQVPLEAPLPRAVPGKRRRVEEPFPRFLPEYRRVTGSSYSRCEETA